MKKKNLKIISGISQDISTKMFSHESTENEGVIILPRTILNEWQKILFEVVVDETKDRSRKGE